MDTGYSGSGGTAMVIGVSGCGVEEDKEAQLLHVIKARNSKVICFFISLAKLYLAQSYLYIQLVKQQQKADK